jgi:hypothetical protein
MMTSPGTIGPLDVGRSATVLVDAREQWNRTGLILTEGQSYSFYVPGEEFWRDGALEVTADGYTRFWLSPFGYLKRVPRANWFRLVGQIGHLPSERFVIGMGLSGHAPRVTGELVCFANDIPWMYWNNSGLIKLTVRRVR